MTNFEDKILVVLIGATAVGKTDASIAIAKHFDTEIISADSRQFFKEMNIGTAVPEPEQLAEVKHHFIQHLSIQEYYSSYDFEQDAIALAMQLFEEKDVVVLTGICKIQSVYYTLWKCVYSQESLIQHCELTRQKSDLFGL